MYWKRWGRVKETVCNNDIKQCIVHIHKRAELQRHEYSLSLGFPHFCVTAFYMYNSLSRCPCAWNKPTQYSNVKNINTRSIERDLSWHQETQPKQIFSSFSCTAEGGQRGAQHNCCWGSCKVAAHVPHLPRQETGCTGLCSLGRSHIHVWGHPEISLFRTS